MPDSDSFATLVARVGEFYVTDKALKNAQKRAAAALATGTIDEAGRRAYLDAVQRYFSGFEREARAHLRSLDRRLEQANQVHFNLAAERGVAVRRLEATQGVLTDIERLERP